MRTFNQSSLLILVAVFRILVLLIAFKFLTQAYGRAGFGTFSQILAVAGLFSVFAGGGLMNGLIREISGSKTEQDRTEWMSAALRISFVSAGILAVVSILLYALFADMILDNPALSWIFLIMGVVQIGTGVGNIALAYFTGTQSVKSLAGASILGAITSLIIILLASWFFGYSGAAFGCAILALGPSIFGISFLSFTHRKLLRTAIITSAPKSKTKRLVRDCMSMLVAAICVPIALISIRSGLGLHSGWEAVGEWQSVAKIGEAYMQIFGILFISILLPRFAAVSPIKSLSLMTKASLPILSLFLCGACVFYLLSDQILELAYSQEFIPASIYVAPQLAGDLMKIIASLFVYRFVAMGKPSVQALGEVLQAIVMVSFFWLLLPYLGSITAVWSYVAGTGVVMIFAALTTLFQRRI